MITTARFHISGKDVEFTPTQRDFVKRLQNQKPLTVAVGPAGTGKTLMSCMVAAKHLMNNDIDKIVITRPTVTVGEDQGYLPGNIDEKMMPWMMPVYDSLSKVMSQHMLNTLVSDDAIEICPFSYIRGRTFDNTWVIADEMQNSTPTQMKALLTRVGENTRVVVTGDPQQSDLASENGLEDLLRHTSLMPASDEMIDVVVFGHDDVKRSEFVRFVLKMYDRDHTCSS